MEAEHLLLRFVIITADLQWEHETFFKVFILPKLSAVRGGQVKRKGGGGPCML